MPPESPDHAAAPAHVCRRARAAQPTISLGDALGVDVEDAGVTGARRRRPSATAARLRSTNRDDVVDRVEVLGNELLVGDPDVVRLLEEADELQHAGRVDDPRPRSGTSSQRAPAGSSPRKKFAARNVADLLFHGRILPAASVQFAAAPRQTPSVA